MPYGLLKGN